MVSLILWILFFFQPYRYILQPTRITDHSAALIDNIFLNLIERFTISGNIVHDLSDHLPNFVIFHHFVGMLKYSKEITQNLISRP